MSSDIDKTISPSEGYLLDETVYPVGAEAENYSIEHNPISMTVTEDIIKGNISIIKHSDDGTTQIETPEVGAEFEVYLKSSGSYEAAKDSEKDYLVCDENGYVATKMLPYGTYIVHQTKGWENTEWIDDFEVIISENEKEYFYLINDAVKKSFVKIVKKDAETGNIIPVSGIGFKVWDCANSEYISQKIYYPSEMILDTFYTDESGSLMLPQELAYGDYELHEVQSAEGYVLDKNPVPFTIDGSVETVVVEKTNTAQKGKISVQKTGDVFASVTALGSAIYIDENGEVHKSGQTTYTPVFAKGNLSGAVFQVIASEDIITLDGTIRANAGDVVAEITTDENGYAETDLLYLGKYEIVEASAPYGYVKNSEIQAVELTYAGQEIAVRDTVNTSFVNDYQGVEISLSKVMEKDELFNIGNSDEYTRVRFGLFAAEEIIAADGSVIPADGLISEISLAENMSAKFDTALPFGKYYVQEIATDEHYVLNGKKYLVNFEYMGQEVTTVTVDCGEFKNALKRGKISGKKVDENEKSLENALFGLFAVDTAEFTADNAYMTAVSDENGHFEFDKIPYGEYIVREIEAPTGYILSDESYPVTISEDGEVIEIKAVNKSTKVRISKQDITTGEELPGATLQIIDEDGNVATEWVSTDEAHFIEGKLIAGKEYTLRETIAPDGYEIASEIKFTVNTDGSVTEVVMYDEHTPDLEIPPTVTIDTPNTGVSADNSAELYLVAAAVIMAFGMVICKRNDKEQRKDDVK